MPLPSRRRRRARARTIRRTVAGAAALACGAALLVQVPLTSAAFSAMTANPTSSFRANSSFCASPGTASIVVQNDTYVRENDPTGNYQNENKVDVRSRAGDDRRAFIRPSLPVIPSQCEVTSAVLWIRTQKYEPNRTHHVHRVSGAWNVSTITWSNQPGVTGAPVAVITGDDWQAMDVTPIIQAIVAAGSGSNHGFRISDSAEGAATTFDHHYTTQNGANAPYVVFTWG